MVKKMFSYAGASGKSAIAAYIYAPYGAVKGVVYVGHGVTEYAERYEDVYKVLNGYGFAVLANDHMGHGRSKGANPMYFEHNTCSGWSCACIDAQSCITIGLELLGVGSDVPVYGMGFSLGSFIIQELAICNPELFAKIILLGTGYQSPVEIAIGKAIAKSECKKHGAHNATPQVSKLTFETYNKSFAGDTRADWLCAYRPALDEYLTDARCGKDFTAGLFYDLLCGMAFVGKQSNIKKLNSNMEVLMLSGKNDAVGKFTKGVKALEKKYQKAGLFVETHFYDGMRHDILHEEHCADVYMDILDFLLT